MSRSNAAVAAAYPHPVDVTQGPTVVLDDIHSAAITTDPERCQFCRQADRVEAFIFNGRYRLGCFTCRTHWPMFEPEPGEDNSFGPPAWLHAESPRQPFDDDEDGCSQCYRPASACRCP